MKSGLPQGIISPVSRRPRPPAATGPDGEEEHPPLPGTMVLVFVFLFTFAVYYFVNWKLLSFVWKIG
jgi:hypothetical protein